MSDIELVRGIADAYRHAGHAGTEADALARVLAVAEAAVKAEEAIDCAMNYLSGAEVYAAQLDAITDAVAALRVAGEVPS